MSWTAYLPSIAKGTLSTVELALLSLAVALVIGVVGALGKLSSHLFIQVPFQLYTTLIRGVPDLLLMLLVFYSIQIGVNRLTDLLGFSQFNINPFQAGVLTLGFIYGAYFAETFRGALLAIERGQFDAALSFGLARSVVFFRITLPQLVRYALPGVSNNWQVLIKATALVSIIGLNDLVLAAQEAGRETFDMMRFMLISAAIYVVLSSASSLVIYLLNVRHKVWAREAEL